MTDWYIHDTRLAMIQAVATIVNSNDGRSIAVPGGATPAAILPHIHAVFRHLTLTDERLVPRSDPLSNAAMVARCGRSDLLPLIDDPVSDITVAADIADARVAKLPCFDLVWLGVGADGHCASWFQGRDYEAAMDFNTRRHVVAVRPSPLPSDAPVPRLTLTLARVASAKVILIAAQGKTKRDVLENPHGTAVESVLRLCTSKLIIHWAP